MRNVGVVDAMRHVAGFTIVDDLSARDPFVRKGVHETSPFCYDWISQKCFDGAMPIGPWITPVAYAGDPSDMRSARFGRRGRHDSNPASRALREKFRCPRTGTVTVTDFRFNRPAVRAQPRRATALG